MGCGEGGGWSWVLSFEFLAGLSVGFGFLSGFLSGFLFRFWFLFWVLSSC